MKNVLPYLLLLFSATAFAGGYPAITTQSITVTSATAGQTVSGSNSFTISPTNIPVISGTTMNFDSGDITSDGNGDVTVSGNISVGGGTFGGFTVNGDLFSDNAGTIQSEAGQFYGYGGNANLGVIGNGSGFDFEVISASNQTVFDVNSPGNVITAALPISGTISAASASGTSNYITAPANSTATFEGDSITQNPNGAGVESWAGLLCGAGTSGTLGTTGTAAYRFFQSGVRYRIGAIGGSVISNGTTGANGAPSSGTTSWSGSVTVLHLTNTPSTGGGYPITGPMVITGTNIPIGTTGVISSGTNLTLSNATTGSSGGTVTVHIGGNNIMDRLGLYYANSPIVTGTPGLFFIMGGANCLNAGESGTSIENDLVAVTGTVSAWGYTPVVSTILPTQYNVQGGAINPLWWSYAQETQRQLVNAFIRAHNLANSVIIDECVPFSGDTAASGSSAIYDSNGVHPIGQGNAILASYANEELKHRGESFPAIPNQIEHPVIFQQPVTIYDGITYTGTNSKEWFNILQPLLGVGQTSYLSFGVNETNFNWAELGLAYHGSSADPLNTAFLGVGNAGGGPFTVNGNGEATLGLSATSAQTVATGGQRLYLNAINAELGLYINNSQTGSETVSEAEMPSLSSGNNVYSWHGGQGTSHDIGFDFYYSSTAASEWGGLNFGGTVNPPIAIFHSTFDTIFNPATNTPTDNGFTVEVNGTAKVDGNLTAAGTNGLILSGTNAGTVTLSSGSATIINANITTSTVIAMSVKTKGGSGLIAPEPVMFSGSCQFSGAVTDTSTYNYRLIY